MSSTASRSARRRGGCHVVKRLQQARVLISNVLGTRRSDNEIVGARRARRFSAVVSLRARRGPSSSRVTARRTRHEARAGDFPLGISPRIDTEVRTPESRRARAARARRVGRTVRLVPSCWISRLSRTFARVRSWRRSCRMSGLDSLMDGWSMSGSLGKKGSSMNAMRSSSGNTAGARSSPPAVSPRAARRGQRRHLRPRWREQFGLSASGAVSGADLDDIFGLGASQPPRRRAAGHGRDRSRSPLLGRRPRATSSPPPWVPSLRPPRRGDPASGTHSDPFGLGGGSSGGVDSLLGSLGGGGGSMNLRGAPWMVPAKKPGEDDRVGGGVGGDDLLGAIFGGASSVPDSGPSSSVAATGGGSRSTSAHASPAGGSSNDLLGDLLGGGGSGVSASGGSPGADSDSSPVAGDARYGRARTRPDLARRRLLPPILRPPRA